DAAREPRAPGALRPRSPGPGRRLRADAEPAGRETEATRPKRGYSSETRLLVRNVEAPTPEERFHVQHDRIVWPDAAYELAATRRRLQRSELDPLDAQHLVHDQPGSY